MDDRANKTKININLVQCDKDYELWGYTGWV